MRRSDSRGIVTDDLRFAVRAALGGREGGRVSGT
jgi:hypothetical protein